MTEIPNAADMRAKLNEAQSRAAQAQISDLVVQINRAVEQGRSCIYISKFEPGVKGLLEQRGYKITYYAGDPRDQRDSSQYTVSW